MYVSERCCSPQGFCAHKDGDRGLGSWHLLPGALQSTRQSQGVAESAFPPVLYTFPARPRHLKPPLLTACGWASCSADCSSCQATKLLTPRCLRPSSQVSLAGERLLLMDLVTKAWEPLCLLSLNLLCSPTVAESLGSLFFHGKETVALRVMRC